MINKKKLEASSYGSCLIKKKIWQAENKFSVIMVIYAITVLQ